MIRALALVGVLLAARPALAGPTCGGSDDSSSSSSSSSSSDSSSDSSTPSEPACVETSDIHGYRRCTQFGVWGRNARWPAISIELGAATRQFASPRGTHTGTVTHGAESFTYRTIDPREPSALDTAVVGKLRVGVGLRHGLYVAVEGEAGALTSTGAEAEMMSTGLLGAPEISAAHAVVLGGLAVAGVGTRLGALDLGVEAAGGAHVLVSNYESHYLACETTTSITQVVPALEARARAALWATPFLSVGLTAGKSLIDDAWVGGVSFGFSSRAFGGR